MLLRVTLFNINNKLVVILYRYNNNNKWINKCILSGGFVVGAGPSNANISS